MQCTAGKAVVFSRNRARSRDQSKAECPWGALGKDGTPLLGGIPLLRRLPEADCPPLRTLTPLTNPAMQVCNNMLLVRKRCLRTNQLNSLVGRLRARKFVGAADEFPNKARVPCTTNRVLSAFMPWEVCPFLPHAGLVQSQRPLTQRVPVPAVQERGQQGRRVQFERATLLRKSTRPPDRTPSRKSA